MSELKNSLNRMKWDSIVIAVITIALGLVCILLPTESASVLTTVLGVCLIVSGVVLFVQFCMLGGFIAGNLLVTSIAMLLVGVLCLMRPDLVQGFLTVLFGLYIFIDSLLALSDSLVCASARVSGWIIMFVCSLVTAVLGIVVMFASFEWVMIFAGASLIVEGVRRLVITLTMSGKVRQAKKILHDAHTVDEDDYNIY